jgi:hypothetical protein
MSDAEHGLTDHIRSNIPAPSVRVLDAMPVEMLRDRKGVFGIGVSQNSDFGSLAWTRGIAEPGFSVPRPLILRTDYFASTKPNGAVLQKIAGSHRSIFRYSTEESLRQFIHHEALERAGLPVRGNVASNLQWWSNDKTKQVENRRTYHGLRLLSLGVVNQLIGELIEAAADPDAIRAARRYPFRYREQIYRASARSRHALQLSDTFPLAALAIYANWRRPYPETDFIGVKEFKAWEAHHRANAVAAAHLVEKGARLRDVAAALELPIVLRHVKPGVSHLVSPLLLDHPHLMQWIPKSTSAARIWLKTISYARRRDSIEHATWVARHVSELSGRFEQVANTIADLLDWIEASARSDRDPFVTRPFTPLIGLKTAMKLSHQWHEALAQYEDGLDAEPLPPCWYPPFTSGKFDIVPLTSSIEIYREGQTMHHCVRTYIDRVRSGEYCIYSVRRDGERVATVSLIRVDGKIFVEQLRGPCNRVPPEAVRAAVSRWLNHCEGQSQF